MLRLCPEHKKALVPQETKYDTRYACPYPTCTVVCWDGPTSTPADYETRQARMKAHNSFDKLWRSGMFTRRNAYKKLADFLGRKVKNTHIGQLDRETALKVQDFARSILGDLS